MNWSFRLLLLSLAYFIGWTVFSGSLLKMPTYTQINMKYLLFLEFIPAEDLGEGLDDLLFDLEISGFVEKVKYHLVYKGHVYHSSLLVFHLEGVLF